MAHQRNLSAVERDLRDIQSTVDQLVRQLAPSQPRRPKPEAARSLLAAVSYKLDIVQAALRA